MSFPCCFWTNTQQNCTSGPFDLFWVCVGHFLDVSGFLLLLFYTLLCGCLYVFLFSSVVVGFNIYIYIYRKQFCNFLCFFIFIFILFSYFLCFTILLLFHNFPIFYPPIFLSSQSNDPLKWKRKGSYFVISWWCILDKIQKQNLLPQYYTLNFSITFHLYNHKL